MPTRGHGLVVEHVLAKDETGVRFSLPAPDERSEDGPGQGESEGAAICEQQRAWRAGVAEIPSDGEELSVTT